MSDQSEADLTEIEARANAATEGPWYWRNSDINVYLLGARSRAVMAFGRMGTQGAQPEFRDDDGLLHGVQKRNVYDFADADFIAHARTDVQVLLAEVRRLRAERDGDEAAVREQIAASCNKLAVVEGEHGRSNYAEIWQEAAEIARGRS